jgi:uncharacterized protein (TIGR00725 family)
MEQQLQQRKPIVGVMGSGQPGPNDALAYKVGRLLALEGYVVLNGGGGGIMEAVSQGAAEAGGLVVGVLPTSTPTAGYPNPYVHIPMYTGMSLARNVINILSSDVVVALPGGDGTLSEVALALNHGRHVVVVCWPALRLPESCSLHLLHAVNGAAEAVAAVGQLLEAR